MSRRSEVSAGILVFRRKPRLELLLAHPGGPYWRNKDGSAWSIPKGNVESGDLLSCAKRDFNEETGLVAFASNTFEMEWPPRSGKFQSFPEIDRIAYFAVASARRKILPGQRPFIEELVEHLRKNAA